MPLLHFWRQRVVLFLNIALGHFSENHCWLLEDIVQRSLWSWDASWTQSVLPSRRGSLMWTSAQTYPEPFSCCTTWCQIIRYWWLAEQVQVLVEGARVFFGFHNPMLSWISFSLPGCFFLATFAGSRPSLFLLPTLSADQEPRSHSSLPPASNPTPTSSNFTF